MASTDSSPTSVLLPALPTSEFLTDLALAPASEQIIGFRIMRSTEIAPAWWAKAIEVGETGSAIVANRFCDEQNKVTMNPNRAKRLEYYTDPIYAETPTRAPHLREAAVTA